MDLTKNRNGNLESETHRACTRCGVIFEKTNKMSICKTCNTNRVKANSPEYKMVARAKNRCKETGLEFNLLVEDIIMPEICPVLGIPLKTNSGKSGAYRDSPSLDRIDNSQGYVVGNIQVISQLANAMKCHATVDELRKFAMWVLETYGESGEIEPQKLIRKEIVNKPRTRHSWDEIVKYSKEEAMLKFNITRKYYTRVVGEVKNRIELNESKQKHYSSEVEF